MLASFKVVVACQLASNRAFSGLSYHLTAISHVHAGPRSQHGPPPPLPQDWGTHVDLSTSCRIFLTDNWILKRMLFKMFLK